MQEITIQDPFGQALAKYSKGLPFGVEIGGGTGDGSTQCIRTRELFSFEIHPDRIARHKYNLDGRQGGLAINQLSSNPMMWMSIEAVEDFYTTTQTKLNQYPLEQIIEWHKDDFRVSRKYIWGHLSLKDKIDFLLLDGGAFSGRAGVKDGLQESERLRLREEKIEQARIDTSAKTFQALGNLATLFAGKSEKEQRRAFEINKKMSMAQTLIETYSAAQGAYRSQLSIPSPEAPIRAAIAAAAAVAAGLLRVQQISRQQFQSPSAGGGGTGGGGGNEGGGMAAPQGNALNPNSQLINPNTGQAQMPPLRAYVVESDVSGIQQRLRMIRQFAQLGN